MSWREWFEKVSLVNRVIMPGGEIYGVSDAEELRYQAYKARLIEELAVSAPDLRTMAILVERPAANEDIYDPRN